MAESTNNTRYSLYEYNGNYYVYDKQTDSIYKDRDLFTKVAARLNSYNPFNPIGGLNQSVNDTVKSIAESPQYNSIKIRGDLKNKILATKPYKENISSEQAYAYMTKSNEKTFTGSDGEKYILTGGKQKEGVKGSDGKEYVLPAEQISSWSAGSVVLGALLGTPVPTRTGFGKSKQKDILNATLNEGKLSDERLSELSGIDSDSSRFRYIKGWYVKLLDDNAKNFGFNYAGAIELDANGYPKQVLDKDGNFVSYDAYINGDYTPEGYDGTVAQNSQRNAFDKYWRDTYGYNTPDTTAKQFYDELVAGERAAGQSAINLANAQTQQLGLQQAAYVKNVTDQLKSERMARLRAGMSESQIASQDMQQLYANMNSLNDQIVASNMAALQGQEQINNAQSTAFQNWIANANQMAQAGSAYSAAQAGDINAKVTEYMNSVGLIDTPSNRQKTTQLLQGMSNSANKQS